MTEPIKLKCANGALLEAPVFEDHKRGSNWLALVDIDGTAPGGLSRRWLDRGRGACLYMVEKLALFDAVEFGADYTTGVGRRHAKRWYGEKRLRSLHRAVGRWVSSLTDGGAHEADIAKLSPEEREVLRAHDRCDWVAIEEDLAPEDGS